MTPRNAVPEHDSGPWASAPLAEETRTVLAVRCSAGWRRLPMLDQSVRSSPCAARPADRSACSRRTSTGPLHRWHERQPGPHRTMVRPNPGHHLTTVRPQARSDQHVVGLPDGEPSRPGSSDHRPPPARKEPLDHGTPQVHVSGHHSGRNRGGKRSAQIGILPQRSLGQMGHVDADDRDVDVPDPKNHDQRSPACAVPPKAPQLDRPLRTNRQSAEHSQAEPAGLANPVSHPCRPPLGSTCRHVAHARHLAASPPPPIEHHSRRATGPAPDPMTAHGRLRETPTGPEGRPAHLVAQGPADVVRLRPPAVRPPDLLQDHDIGIEQRACADHVERDVLVVDARVQVQ